MMIQLFSINYGSFDASETIKWTLFFAFRCLYTLQNQPQKSSIDSIINPSESDKVNLFGHFTNKLLNQSEVKPSDVAWGIRISNRSCSSGGEKLHFKITNSCCRSYGEYSLIFLLSM